MMPLALNGEIITFLVLFSSLYEKRTESIFLFQVRVFFTKIFGDSTKINNFAGKINARKKEAGDG
jgi:hypothetical protein